MRLFRVSRSASRPKYARAAGNAIARQSDGRPVGGTSAQPVAIGYSYQSEPFLEFERLLGDHHHWK
jgi:hypothetical protein